MSFTIELTKDNSETQPENLDKLVDWVRVETSPYNTLCDYINKIFVDKQRSYKTLEDLFELEMAHEISLRNANRKIHGKTDILMCATLHFIYSRAYRALDEELANISRSVAKGDFKLVDGGYTLLAGYSGKCSSHSWETLEKRGSLDCTCTDKWNGEYLTYRQIFHELRTLTEQAANAVTVG